MGGTYNQTPVAYNQTPSRARTSKSYPKLFSFDTKLFRKILDLLLCSSLLRQSLLRCKFGLFVAETDICCPWSPGGVWS